MNTKTIHEYHFYAMGSHMTVWLQWGTDAEARPILCQAQAQFEAAERCMSRFDAQSELSQLNERAGEWVQVSRPLWRVVNRALRLAAETNGLFDPTLLNAMLASSYRDSFAPSWAWQNSEWGLADTAVCGQWPQIECDAARHALRIPDGVRLDLGGIGKGYTAQQVVEYLSLWGPCLVDAGGDVTAGDAPAGQPGWLVSVAAPGQPETAEAVLNVWLNNATLATSGVDYRWWLQDGERRHHLIDPRTGYPAATDVVTASVLAVDACRAEAWAKAALISGTEPGFAQLNEQGLAAVLVTQNGRVLISEPMVPFVGQQSPVEHEGELIHA